MSETAVRRGRPPIFNERESITFSLSKAQAEKVRKQANKQGVSVSAYIRLSLDGNKA